MDGLQDGSRVTSIHLLNVSTFSFKSLLVLAAVCSLLTAWPGPGKDMLGLPQWRLEDLPLQLLPQTPSLPHLDMPSF